LIGRTAYAVASDPGLVPIDGSSLYAEGNDVVRLGGDDMVALGGGISFAPRSGSFLLNMLPAFMHIPAMSAGAAAIAAVLGLLDAEAGKPAMGQDTICARLAEVLMVQAIRAFASDATDGWLGALADPRIGRAIQCIHHEISRPWTVADLAAEAGMSRAAFSAAFTRRVGQPPLAYVRTWRMTRARAALADGSSNVGCVAASVGYTSQSAFGHAFRRTFGAAPRRNAA
jgi:transcriptional regulator GlxA family with amidase domain